MTPNQVTAVSALFSAAGILALGLLEPSGALGVAVAGLLAIGYALDSADGQLARLTGLGRPSGEWLDHTVDSAKICALHAAVLLSWWQWGPSGDSLGLAHVALPLAFLMVNILAFFGWLLADLLMRLLRAQRGIAKAPDRGPATALRSLLRLPSDYGLLVLTFLLWASPAFPAIYAVLMAANLVILLAALPTWFGQVRHAEQEAS
jgi:phosphatidylglycerophosphate synthase